MHKKSGFTLIELLVVIAIIIVLAGMIFAVGPAVIDRGKKVQAAADVNSITNGAKSFYVDYGQYPLDDSRAADGQNQNRDAVYGALNDTVFGNDQLFNILRATGYGDDTDHVKNPRQVIYVEPRSVKDPSKPQGGISFNDGRWYDPWGTQYVIFLDANYNGQIDGTSPFTDTYNTGNSNGGTPGTGVAVASFGKDKVPGSKTGSGDTQGNKNLAGSDDVTSWR
jgi:prepilin-type N-terminal cleavage/methylation domain-containing protein